MTLKRTCRSLIFGTKSIRHRVTYYSRRQRKALRTRWRIVVFIGVHF
jgi:hypothetical protein